MPYQEMPAFHKRYDFKMVNINLNSFGHQEEASINQEQELLMRLAGFLLDSGVKLSGTSLQSTKNSTDNSLNLISVKLVLWILSFVEQGPVMDMELTLKTSSLQMLNHDASDFTYFLLYFYHFTFLYFVFFTSKFSNNFIKGKD